MTRFKKILLSLMVVGALGSITGARVWATISSESRNSGATIAGGTLTANLTLSGGTGTCYSYKNTGTFTMTLSSTASAAATSITVASVPAAIAAGTVLRLVETSATAGGHTEIVTVSSNISPSGSPVVIGIVSGLVYSHPVGTGVFTDNYNEQGCDAVYVATVWMYPGVLQKANLTLKDDGSKDAVDAQMWMPTCTKVDTPSLPAYAHLGGDPCASSDVAGGSGVIFYVQETQSDFTTTDSTHHCWYPSTANSCPLTGSLNDFSTNNNSSTFSLDLGPGPKRADSASNTRYFVIGTELPTNASNTLQGEAATFPLSWHLQGNG